MARAASTYSMSRTLSTALRTIRAKVGTQEMARAITRLTMLAPRAATMTMAISIMGTARNTSHRRMITLSTAPPKKPAMAPRMPPTTRPKATAMKPMDRDTRLPWTTRASRSRPNWSVPNQCSAEGHWSRSAIFRSTQVVW